MTALQTRIAGHFSETFRTIWKCHPEGAHAEGTGWHRLHTRLPHPYGNIAVLEQEASLDAAQQSLEPFKNPGYPVCVISLNAEPAKELDQGLRVSGYSIVEPMPLMAVPLDRLQETHLPNGIEFLEVTDPQPWAEAFAPGFAVPIEIAQMCGMAIKHSEFRLFAARRGDKVIATSMLVLLDGLAGIYCVATLPEERRQGIGAHMTAEPLRIAASEGYETGVLQSSDAGYPVYHRLGFEDLSSIPIYVRIPAS